MRKWIIGTGVTIVALALGVAAAYGGSRLIRAYRPQIRDEIQNMRGNPAQPNGAIPPAGVWGRAGKTGGGNGGAIGPLQSLRDRMQGPSNRNSGTAIPFDQAVQAAQDYAAGLGSNFQLAQVLEFRNGFYGIITEKDTGRGALEVLIDPASGRVLPEAGPLLMWNLKYGRMGNGAAQTGDNTITLDQARLAAQAFLDKAHPGAKLNEGGVAFYGYYALVYSVDGKTAGVLGVNGTTQQVWEPAGLGAFVAEKEMTQ